MIKRLNHAVLKVRDLEHSVEFYQRVLGFELIARERAVMAFLRAPGSLNHHDLGLFAVGAGAPDAPERSPGLFHLAWEVERIEDLASMRDLLTRENALTGASDHGATKSLYAADPDGNEFEVTWLVPKAAWGDLDHQAPTLPLDLERELARWG
jgi:catechol-2,3-dioxygenase